jgi:DNA repair exonuclease SbcCD ATPase subunit
VKLVQLRARGFRRLQELVVDLDHERLLVIGANEAGKSTLLEALLAGIFGLAPAKRGSGHAPALRAVQPWNGEPASLTLQYRLDEGRLIEVDWDFTAERTRVIDHEKGEEITADFTAGTHGWLDVGERLLGLPGGVFRQVTCVGEGQLASLSDEADIRQAVLQLTDAGVDVLVEQALARLDEAARQATVPRANSATRRNELGRWLKAAEIELEAAVRAREELETEVAGIRDTEVALNGVRKKLARILADDEARETERQRLRSEMDRAEGRLAEAELRLASASEGAEPSRRAPWSEEDLGAARARLVSSPPATGLTGRESVVGVGLAVSGVMLLAFGIVLGALAASVLGLMAVGAGVFVLTRGRGVLGSSISIGDLKFPNRQALMVALDEERVRRDHSTQLDAVHMLRKQLDGLVELSQLSDDELELRLREVGELQSKLQLQLERERASYERGSQMVPEVAPLEERVADLRQRIERLDEFGVAAARAAATLGAAAEEIRRSYAPKLQQYLGRDLNRVTGGRYTEAVVSDRFDVMLRAPETGSMVEMAQLSRGTQQQVYLLLRLGLLEIMGTGTETLPMFLDDALALADDRRRMELLRVLESEQRQVVYFTAGESSSVIFGRGWQRIEMSAPLSDVSRNGAGNPPMAVVEGPV